MAKSISQTHMGEREWLAFGQCLISVPSKHLPNLPSLVQITQDGNNLLYLMISARSTSQNLAIVQFTNQHFQQNKRERLEIVTCPCRYPVPIPSHSAVILISVLHDPRLSIVKSQVELMLPDCGGGHKFHRN